MSNKKITIDGIKYIPQSEAKSVSKSVIINGNKTALKIGEKYFFRTVTYFSVGRVVNIFDDAVELEESAWVADTGRFREAIMTGVLSEVEPVEVPHFVVRSAIVDFFVWTHDLPREQK